MRLIPTGSQTIGPFFNFGLTADPKLGTMARDGAEGDRIRLEFRVLDGDGAPAPGDAMIELWQADAQGRYTDGDPHFCGFGRLETDLEGVCVFDTIKPGRVGPQAPHINVTVFARGLLKHLHTRAYFGGEPSNAEDPALALVPEERRATLLAQPVAGRPGTWRMEIRLQGEGETVFFDV
jgi:protocatechuate 3,4-dioxygenase alpha subunit